MSGVGLACAESMDSPSSLHPIVLQHIESPPFQYSPRGLTFKGHARETVDDLKRWLKKQFSERGLTFQGRARTSMDDLKCWLNEPQNPTFDRQKDWWLAQLRLYGMTTTTRMTKADMVFALVAAISGGMNEPTEEILQLERKLEQKYLQASAEAREKEYASLNEEERLVKYSQRYLSEKFFSGTDDESVMVFWIHQEWYDGQNVHDAAADLGLHSADTRGARERKLIVVGKEKIDVQKEVTDWEKEYKEWKGRCRGARRRVLQE